MLKGQRRGKQLAARRAARDLLRMGTQRDVWWVRVAEKEARCERSCRANAYHRKEKQAKLAARVPFNKRQRWLRQQAAEFKQAQLQSKRRAVLIHENGDVSPLKMLPFTSHPKGVIGSFLGGTPQILAARPSSGVVLLGIQDSICDDEWEMKAYALLKSLNLQKRVGKIYGRALCVRFRPYKNNVLLDDMPLTMFTTGSCANIVYTHQVHAAEEQEPTDDTNESAPGEVETAA